MYRRRRQTGNKISFGFDSFLDIIANVIGIVLRLILVAWVGARAYTTGLEWVEQEPPADAIVATSAASPGTTPRPAPRAEDDPVSDAMRETSAEIKRARDRLVEQMKKLDLVHTQQESAEKTLLQFAAYDKKLDEESKILKAIDEQRGTKIDNVTLALGELQERSRKLMDSIRELENKPTATKMLRYRTPVSRPVREDELFFELKNGRVSFIDIEAFMQEIRHNLKEKVDALRTQWEVEAQTRTVGAFRLHYTVERRRSYVDKLAKFNAPPRDENFSYGLSAWRVDPVDAARGESFKAAVTPGSKFRGAISGLEDTAVVTLWVYPDSFELFRRLRDFLHEYDVEVAGRPLPFDAPIAAARDGTASRGQ